MKTELDKAKASIEFWKKDSAAAWNRCEEYRKALKECAKERRQLLEGCVYADNELGVFRDKYFDQYPPEGSMGTPEYAEINELQAHLYGTAIGDDGEYMKPDKYDWLLSAHKEGQP